MVLGGDLSQISLQTARLTLRSFTAADATESFVAADASVARYMSWNPPVSEAEFETIWQKSLSDMKSGSQLSLVIRNSATREFLGSAGLHPADADLLETGIWIKTSAQGQGYGREAVAALMAWAGGKFHASALLWPVVEENLPSRKLAESLGGKVIGSRQRQKPGDVSRNLLVYAIPCSR